MRNLEYSKALQKLVDKLTDPKEIERAEATLNSLLNNQHTFVSSTKAEYTDVFTSEFFNVSDLYREAQRNAEQINLINNEKVIKINDALISKIIDAETSKFNVKFNKRSKEFDLLNESNSSSEVNAISRDYLKKYFILNGDFLDEESGRLSGSDNDDDDDIDSDLPGILKNITLEQIEASGESYTFGDVATLEVNTPRAIHFRRLRERRDEKKRREQKKAYMSFENGTLIEHKSDRNVNKSELVSQSDIQKVIDTNFLNQVQNLKQQVFAVWKCELCNCIFFEETLECFVCDKSDKNVSTTKKRFTFSTLLDYMKETRAALESLTNIIKLKNEESLQTKKISKDKDLQIEKTKNEHAKKLTLIENSVRELKQSMSEIKKEKEGLEKQLVEVKEKESQQEKNYKNKLKFLNDDKNVKCELIKNYESKTKQLEVENEKMEKLKNSTMIELNRSTGEISRLINNFEKVSKERDGYILSLSAKEKNLADLKTESNLFKSQLEAVKQREKEWLKREGELKDSLARNELKLNDLNANDTGKQKEIASLKEELNKVCTEKEKDLRLNEEKIVCLKESLAEKDQRIAEMNKATDSLKKSMMRYMEEMQRREKNNVELNERIGKVAKSSEFLVSQGTALSTQVEDFEKQTKANASWKISIDEERTKRKNALKLHIILTVLSFLLLIACTSETFVDEMRNIPMSVVRSNHWFVLPT